MDCAPTRATLVGMSEDQRQNDNQQDDENGEDQPAPTPFDNPFFLPVVLWALAAWFAWDVITGAEAYQKYPLFNLGGLAILAPAALYYTWSAIKEHRADREGSNN